MRKILLSAGMLVTLGGLILWMALGANRGWTKTSVMITTVDEVTQLEAVEHKEKFVPGLEFLAATFGAGFLLCAIGLIVKKPKAA